MMDGPPNVAVDDSRQEYVAGLSSAGIALGSGFWPERRGMVDTFMLEGRHPKIPPTRHIERLTGGEAESGIHPGRFQALACEQPRGVERRVKNSSGIHSSTANGRPSLGELPGGIERIECLRRIELVLFAIQVDVQSTWHDPRPADAGQDLSKRDQEGA